MGVVVAPEDLVQTYHVSALDLARTRLLLEVARGGRGGVLVIHGDPGVGKTALLEHAVEAGPDFRVVRAGGVEGEMELAFAALQQLCAPILEL